MPTKSYDTGSSSPSNWPHNRSWTWCTTTNLKSWYGNEWVKWLVTNVCVRERGFFSLPTYIHIIYGYIYLMQHLFNLVKLKGNVWMMVGPYRWLCILGKQFTHFQKVFHFLGYMENLILFEIHGSVFKLLDNLSSQLAIKFHDDTS